MTAPLMPQYTTDAFDGTQMVFYDSDGAIMYDATVAATMLEENTDKLIRRLAGRVDRKGSPLTATLQVQTPGGPQVKYVLTYAGMTVAIMERQTSRLKNSAVAATIEARKLWMVDVVHDVEANGYHVSPNATLVQLDQAAREIEHQRGRAREDLEILKYAQGMVDGDWLQVKAQLVVSRFLGEAPTLRNEEIPVILSQEMIRLGMPAKDADRFKGAFGGAVNKAYQIEHGHSRGKVPQEVGNRTVMVYAYNRADLPLIERVFHEKYSAYRAD